MSNYSNRTSLSPNNYGGDGMGGLGLLGESLPDTIKIDHVFTLKFSDKWERPVRKWIDKFFDLSKHYAESFHYIAAGIGSYLFFLGVSKVIQANRINANSNCCVSSNNNSKSKKTDKDEGKNKDKDKDNTSTSNILSRKKKTKKCSNIQLPPSSISSDNTSKNTSSDLIVSRSAPLSSGQSGEREVLI